jgi:hypothetical protein
VSATCWARIVPAADIDVEVVTGIQEHRRSVQEDDGA